jgi:WD40 repeat protein
MGNNFSSENSSNDNSQQQTPGSNHVVSRLSGLSLADSSNNLQDQSGPSTSGINQGPPSLIEATAIAARQRLIEELHYIAQQRIIDELNQNLTNSGDSNDTQTPALPHQRSEVETIRSEEPSRRDSIANTSPEQNDSSNNQNDNDDSNNSDDNPFAGISLLQRIQISLLRRQLGIRNDFNMLSDHSEDEEEIRQRRINAKKQCQAPCYITVPSPKNIETHMSYKRLRNDIITRSGLAFDIPPKSVTQIDSISDATPETVTEEALFQPSCSSIRSITRNAKFGVGPPRLQHGSVALPTRGFINAIDKSQLVACRNNITPNRRKIIDKNQTKTFCAHYIRDGEGLLTASQDHNIRIYERKTARQRYVKTCTIEVPFVGWSILDVAVSPNGRHVIYSTWNNVLYQFDLENEDCGWQDMPFEMNDSRFGIFSIKFNSTGSEVMAGTTSGLYIYNREIDRCVMKVDGHEDDINAVCFANEDSNLVLSSGDDGLVKLWDRRTMGYEGEEKPVAIFAGHRDGITFIDSRHDDRYFLTNSKDQSIKVWDLRIHSSRTGIDATRRSVKGQKWDYRWQYLPSSSIKTTNLPGDSSVMTIRGHSVLHTLIRSRFSPDHTGKRFIYTGCARVILEKILNKILKEFF